MINFTSSLFNQDTFYRAVKRDLVHATKVVVIESPFITRRRVMELLPIFKKLVDRGVRVIINTKPLEEHNEGMYDQALWSIAQMQDLGASVYMTIGHHRKLIVVDNKIIWEGSLNVLSQFDSCEFMRRIESEDMALQTIKFLNLDRICKLN